MTSLENIQAPIRNEMEEFERRFRQSMKSDVPLLDKVTSYILKRKGKQIRPMFVFLTAKMFGKVNQSSYNAAALIELLHTATLVHDDVVDGAFERRGFFSVNALWKNKISVLIGDYLLSRGLLLAVDSGEFNLLRIVSNAVKQMSEGELLQIEKARRLDVNEKIYFEIIRQKTAVLIASCCACGAVSAKAGDDIVKKMWDFGEKTGIAFQLKDDLFDYGSADIGKPTGIDIKEKKMTLPLIYALSKSTWIEKKKIINAIKNHNDDFQRVQEVIGYVLKSGGIEYAKEKMMKYQNEALMILNSLPANDSREKLEQLVRFTVERKN